MPLRISIADGGFTFNSVRQRVPYDMDLVTVAVVHKANTEEIRQSEQSSVTRDDVR